MTAQVATLELSHSLAVELHALFRALDLRIQTPELVRDKLEAAGRALDELLEAEWNLVPDAVAQSVERVAELLREWTPDDVETWADLKAQLREAYAGFASALQAEQVAVPELRPTNYTRSAFHMMAAGVCLMLVTTLTPEQLPWVAGGFAVWGWSLETLRRISATANRWMMVLFRPIAHEQERHRVNSATWYVTALVLLTLTYSPLLSVVGVAVLGFADPIAGLVGRRWGRIRLANNRSLEGSLTFVVVGTAAALVAMQLVQPTLGPGLTWAVAVTAAVAGAFAELLSRRVDDNFSIPLVAAGSVAALLALVGTSPWP
ncbi:MAG: hypothetical protein K0V04_40230 [Deltaproteobacteria bacterium]|nr:hypothetical protein [Deltaproteobacteria bacterium]